VSPPRSLTRIQELVYEIRVSEVMARQLVTVCPETSMGELRETLRANRISGAPVIADGKLLGIISIEDFINWLATGPGDVIVGDRMTREVVTAYDDEPLVHAVNKLNRHGFGRLPVVERRGGKLVGVVTKGDIMRGLLRKLEIEYHEEETRRYSRDQILDDFVADKTMLMLQYTVVGKDFTQAGSGATRLKKTLGRLGVEPGVLRRVGIIAYEAEMNIVIYTDGGELLAKVEPGMITFEATDSGPGIPDVDLALTAGYSTADEWVRELGFGAGMGLCNIKACADEMHLNSVVGTGTRLQAKIAV